MLPRHLRNSSACNLFSASHVSSYKVPTFWARGSPQLNAPIDPTINSSAAVFKFICLPPSVVSVSHMPATLPVAISLCQANNSPALRRACSRPSRTRKSVSSARSKLSAQLFVDSFAVKWSRALQPMQLPLVQFFIHGFLPCCCLHHIS